jgi:hypothetical protein
MPQSLSVDLWRGNVRHGQAVVNGFFFIYDEKQRFFQMSWADLIQVFKTDDYFASYTCSFAWIRDLKATGDMSARRLARRMIEFWIEGNLAKKVLIKSPKVNAVVSARRLSSWTLLFDFFGTSSHDVFKKIFFSGVQGEYKRIKSALMKKYSREDKLAIIKALVEYNIYWAYDPSFFKLMLFEILAAIPGADGALTIAQQPITSLFNNFCVVVELRSALRQWEKSLARVGSVPLTLFNDVFQKIQQYLRTVTAVIRYYRHSNGSLSQIKASTDTPIFNEYVTPEKVDIALSQIEDVFVDDFAAADVLRFAEKNSVLFIDLGMHRPRHCVLEEFGKNLANDVLNFEWSVDANNIVNRNSFMLFQRDRIPTFLRKKGSIPDGHKTIKEYWQQQERDSFFFKAAVPAGEFEENACSFAREIRLFSPENLVCGADALTVVQQADSLWLMQFHLGYNLKLIDKKHDDNQQKGYIFYELHQPDAVKNKKIPKKRVLFVVESKNPFFLKASTVHDHQLITFGCSIERALTAEVTWSFQVLKA